MKRSTLVRRGLTHYRRTHVGVVLGVACAAAVLVGALVVGDSVRLSLRDQAARRIGRVDAALLAPERFFLADLAERIAGELDGATVAPALRLSGLASRTSGDAKSAIAQVIGVDDRFFALSPGGSGAAPPPAERVFVNERLAAHLGMGPGDELLVGIEKPTHLPRDMVLSTVEDISFSVRASIAGVLGPDQFGHLDLHASQVPPFTVFVSLSWLQNQVKLAGRANALFIGGTGDSPDRVKARANTALRRHWRLADAEIRLATLPGATLTELTSGRIFVETAVADAVQELDGKAVGILTYFVNSVSHGDRRTPYSMVAAVGPLRPGEEPAVPAARQLAELAPPPDGIVLGQWMADDLGAKPGTELELAYWTMGSALRLTERTHRLRVSRVVPVAGAAADRSLMPPFPGLADAEDCGKWEPGVPVDLKQIRDKDEVYWDDHRGTPKGFVSLPTGRELWSNRFGSVTAIRTAIPQADLARDLPRRLDPTTLGLFFRDVRSPAEATGTSATDFGGLFFGLSFFLILAGLLLTSLLFVFGVEQRANEIGLLLAAGFRPQQVRALFLWEATVLAVIGATLGAFAGLAYTRGVLLGLDTIWRGAVGATHLELHARPLVVVGGAAGAVAMALLTLFLTIRKICRHPPLELLRSRQGIPGQHRHETGPGRVRLAIEIGAAVAALLLVVLSPPDIEALAFFGAGALLLTSSILGRRRRLERLGTFPVTSVLSLGRRNAGRRVGRSLATIILLASGVFLVVSVQAHRLRPPADASERSSGTGGFALFGRTSLPVSRDLMTPEGREAFGLEADDFAGTRIVPLRVREGDDASCLNLSQPRTPRLLGVHAKALASRGSFRFIEHLAPDRGDAPESPWSLLDADFGDAVPAVGDQASLQWILKKAVGDTLTYTDEHGRAFPVRIVGAIANTILQGNLVISDAHFARRFPSASGHRMFLIDAPADRVEALSSRLTRALEDVGLELTTTAERLESFNAVQNTYLVIFQMLGGLGLLLGSVGLGMVVLRNALERRGELAVCGAVGFDTREIRRIVWTEHALLLFYGLSAGTLCAAVAILPSLRGAGADVAWVPMLIVVGGVAVSGALWVWLATRLATRGPLLTALREE